MTKRKKKKVQRLRNKKLIKRYPFLQINRNNHNISTYLDEMPEGWNRAFGELLCEELRIYLQANNCLSDYSLLQVKEKYGELCWYDSLNRNSPAINVYNIVERYEYISSHCCVDCGKLDVPRTKSGWIIPICDECRMKRDKRMGISKEVSDENVVYESMQLTFNVNRYSKEGKQVREVDCSDLVAKIQKKQTKREKER